MLRTVSFLTPPRFATAENISVGGLPVIPLKNENGARLLMPCLLRVPAQAMGRGATEPIKILYISALDSCLGSRIIERDQAARQGGILALQGLTK